LNTSITYTSARLNSSEDIAGIPTDDETALNPALTDDAIKNGEVKNCTKGDSGPPTFSFEETPFRMTHQRTSEGSFPS
jgi:hypothetical protein